MTCALSHNVCSQEPDWGDTVTRKLNLSLMVFDGRRRSRWPMAQLDAETDVILLRGRRAMCPAYLLPRTPGFLINTGVCLVCCRLVSHRSAPSSLPFDPLLSFSCQLSEEAADALTCLRNVLEVESLIHEKGQAVCSEREMEFVGFRDYDLLVTDVREESSEVEALVSFLLEAVEDSAAPPRPVCFVGTFHLIWNYDTGQVHSFLWSGVRRLGFKQEKRWHPFTMSESWRPAQRVVQSTNSTVFTGSSLPKLSSPFNEISIVR